MPLDEQPTPRSPTWPPLDRTLLSDTRPAPPPFPLHLLPGRWRGWVEASSRAFGAPDYLAHGLLGGVAGVCGAGMWIRVAPHWHEPLVLWQALIGGPSSGKSASFGRVRTLLAAVRPHEESGDRAAPAVAVDGSLSQVASALSGSSRGVLLWREDLAAWMDEARRRAVRPAWLAGWSAAPAHTGRHRDEESFAVGIAGTLTPERLLHRTGFLDGDSALAARFLYAWPERGPRDVSLTDDEADDEGIAALLQKIADLAGHRETPGCIGLDEAGARRLEELIATLRQRAEACDGLAAEWIAKGAPTVARLAGLLSLMGWAETDVAEPLPVGAEHVEAAHELWSGYYLPHALRVFEPTSDGASDHVTRRVTRWLARTRLPEISREEVRREALCQAVDAETAEDVLARLETAGLLRPLLATGSTKGGPRRRRWAVHPDLAS
ncbi:MAG TPA: DUF3987 domain-containing protein [Reyranella sp.]|nr:DUF3987 domain-containing protein [Reyranella sp.]